jgi:hypothetical protein
MKVVLSKNAESVVHCTHSIEAGLNDGRYHFDHHGQCAGQPAPCEAEIKPAEAGSVIVITHLDADTLVGLAKLLGRPFEDDKLDFGLMARIDEEGSFGYPIGTTREFMVGVGVRARQLEFPRCSATPVEVTGVVEQLLATSVDEFISLGKKAIAETKAAVRDFLVEDNLDGKVGLWNIPSGCSMDPSAPYESGFEVVVMYRDDYKNISIYARPNTPWTFAGKMFDGILFAGHPKACGSPRGEEFGLADAIGVMRDIRLEED